MLLETAHKCQPSLSFFLFMHVFIILVATSIHLLPPLKFKTGYQGVGIMGTIRPTPAGLEQRSETRSEDLVIFLMALQE